MQKLHLLALSTLFACSGSTAGPTAPTDISPTGSPGTPNAADACIATSPGPVASGKYATQASPIDIGLAIPGATDTFGIAAQGASTFIVGVRASEKWFLTRYTDSFALDTTFGTAGIVSIDASDEFYEDLRVLEDGSIFVIGGKQKQSSAFLAVDRLIRHFDKNGQADPTYGANGAAILSFGPNTQVQHAAWAVGADGSVVLGEEVRDGNVAIGALPNDEYRYVLARVDTHGAFDAAFGRAGKVDVSGFDIRFAPPSVALRPDGRIAFAAESGSYDCAEGQYCPPTTWFQLSVFGLDGAPDASASAVRRDGFGQPVALLPSGKVLVSGATSTSDPRCALFARLDANGALDATFGVDGRAEGTCGAFHSYGRGVARASDGSVLVAGSTAVGASLMRVTSCGGLDATFGQGGIASVTFDPSFVAGAEQPAFTLTASAVLGDGHIVATGRPDARCGDCSAPVKPFAIVLDAAGRPVPLPTR